MKTLGTWASNQSVRPFDSEAAWQKWVADQEEFKGGAPRLPAVQLSRQGRMGTAASPDTVKGQAQGQPKCKCPHISAKSAEGHTLMQHFLAKMR